MRNYFIPLFKYLSYVFFISSFLISCQKEQDFEFPIKNEITRKDKLSILELGFDTTNISITNEGYIVEGDILLLKNKLENYLQGMGSITRQARVENLIARNGISPINIKIKIDASIYQDINGYVWSYAISSAIEYWNSISESCLNFSTTTNNDYDILITKSYLGSNVAGQGSWPMNGKPGPTIKLNLDVFSHYNSLQKIYVIAHEIGHNIGLRHTNWAGISESSGIGIPGTPNTGTNPDPSSIMNGETAGFSWQGFSKYDIIAITTLYPYIGPPNPNSIITRIGYENTLYPNIPHFNNAGAIWQGKGTILEYQWEAGGWSIIPNPNSGGLSDPSDTMSAVQFIPISSPGSPTYVRIRARNNYGWGNWSDLRVVNVDRRSN